MVILQLLPAALAALVLGAHFLRVENPAMVAASLALIVLLFIRRGWAMRTVQVCLLLGTAEWVGTIFNLVRERQEDDQPYVRMAVILGSVAAITAGAAALLQAKAARRWFVRHDPVRDPSDCG